nr:tetratricopeptide repeat protein [uncultured Carboxylicivirga sp.]
MLIDNCLVSLAPISLVNKNYDDAIKINETLKANYKLTLKEKAQTIHNLAIVYKNRDEYEKSITYFDTSLVYFNELNDLLNISKTRSGIAFNLLRLKKYNQAEDLLRQTLTSLPDSGYWGTKTYIYNIFIELFANLGQSDSIFKYVNIYRKTNKIISDQTDQRTILDLSAKYEAAKKDKELVWAQKKMN